MGLLDLPSPPKRTPNARMVRFGAVAQKLVPGAGAALDTVYIERQRAVAGRSVKKAEGAKSDTSDFVLRLVSE